MRRCIARAAVVSLALTAEVEALRARRRDGDGPTRGSAGCVVHGQRGREVLRLTHDGVGPSGAARLLQVDWSSRCSATVSLVDGPGA